VLLIVSYKTRVMLLTEEFWFFCVRCKYDARKEAESEG
jgi:hypothetical protein